MILSVGGLDPLIAAVAEDGHRVIEAYDVGHLLQLVMRGTPDVVVMPEDAQPANGEEILPLVRRLTTAAILLVGAGDEIKMANALFHGADYYVRYPEDAGKVRSRIRVLLRRRVRPDDDNGPSTPDGPRS